MATGVSDLRRAAKVLEWLEHTRQVWDFASFERGSGEFEKIVARLSDWREYVAGMDAELRAKRDSVKADTYCQALESEFRKAGLPFEGAFPAYRIPPFELRIGVDDGAVHLRMGRSTEKTGVFEPAALAAWVKSHYDKIARRSFNARRFFRELRAAYEVANRLQYGKLLWGKAVSLKKIYELLTLRSETRGEYLEAHFVYDLARLRDEGLTYDSDSLEFGNTRNPKGSYLIPHLSSGREERFSTLTIHRKEC